MSLRNKITSLKQVAVTRRIVSNFITKFHDVTKTHVFVNLIFGNVEMLEVNPVTVKVENSDSTGN